MGVSNNHGKICYVELPTADVSASAAFYRDCFGWSVRTRGDGSTAFDDPTGAVSGTWVTDRRPSDAPGMLIYVMVDDIDLAVQTVSDHGGMIVQPVGGDAPELTARFRDPGGNVIGLYEEPRS